jgi:methylthioribose-1-phosphate isomerase
VLAARHGVPFYVAAPLSTVDLARRRGRDIPIEERDGDEVATFAGRRICPAASLGFNLAFDVTPAELVTAHVNERGVLLPPFGPAIAAALC